MKLFILLFILVGCRQSNTLSQQFTSTIEPIECVGALEIVSKLYLDNTKTIVYSERVDSIAGNKFLITIQAEITNDNSFNVGVGRYLLINGQLVRPAVMSNVTHEMHHGVINYQVTYESAGGELQIDWIMYAVNFVTTENAFVIIEPCYGYMQITKLNI